MSQTKSLYEDPNIVVFGGKITQFLEGKNTHGNLKIEAKLVNSHGQGKKTFDTVVGVTAYGAAASKMKDLYESHSYCLVHGRLASNRGDDLFVIPSQVFDGGVE